jgi:tripartite-type tricarboxylate transporter receptor subunit TctC
MTAPLGTPAAIIAKVGTDLTKVLNDPQVKTKLATTGSYVQLMTADETQAFVASQQATWLPLLDKVMPK